MVKYTNLKVGECYNREGNFELGKLLSKEEAPGYGYPSLKFEKDLNFELLSKDYEFTKVDCETKKVETVTGKHIEVEDTEMNLGDKSTKGGKRRGKKSRKQRKAKKSRKTRATRKH